MGRARFPAAGQKKSAAPHTTANGGDTRLRRCLAGTCPRDLTFLWSRAQPQMQCEHTWHPPPPESTVPARHATCSKLSGVPSFCTDVIMMSCPLPVQYLRPHRSRAAALAAWPASPSVEAWWEALGQALRDGERQKTYLIPYRR